MKKIEKEEEGIKLQLLVTQQNDQQVVHKWLEEHVLKLSNKRKSIEDELASLKIAQDQLSIPIQRPIE